MVTATPLTLRRSVSWQGGPALALWPTPDMLAALDETSGVTAIGAVPWLLEDIEPWRLSRQPTDLLGLAAPAEPPVIEDPVVRVALEHLTVLVNLSSGLTHPSDKANVVAAFRALHKARHTWDPDKVHAWALANGWRNHGAEDLRRIAAGTQAGRSFRTTGAGLRPDIVRIWEAEASEAGG